MPEISSQTLQATVAERQQLIVRLSDFIRRYSRRLDCDWSEVEAIAESIVLQLLQAKAIVMDGASLAEWRNSDMGLTVLIRRSNHSQFSLSMAANIGLDGVWETCKIEQG